MIYFKHLFGILTLQTGTVLLSSLFITLAICILEVNVLSLNVEDPWAWIVMFLSVIILVIIWLIAFYGAYKESNTFISAAITLWTVYLIVWLGLVVWSLIDPQNKIVHLESRCLNVLWILNNSWSESCHKENELINSYIYKPTLRPTNIVRSQYERTYKLQSYNVSTVKNKPTRTNKRKTITSITPYVMLLRATSEHFENQFVKATKYNNEAVGEFHGTTTPSKIHRNSILSMFASFIYALLLLFSLLVLISYRREIQLQTEFINNIS